jgi:hypothetical protein
MIAKKKDFHDKWETLQRKLGVILTYAYHGGTQDYADAIASAEQSLNQLKALASKDE